MEATPSALLHIELLPTPLLVLAVMDLINTLAPALLSVQLHFQVSMSTLPTLALLYVLLAHIVTTVSSTFAPLVLSRPPLELAHALHVLLALTQTQPEHLNVFLVRMVTSPLSLALNLAHHALSLVIIFPITSA